MNKVEYGNTWSDAFIEGNKFGFGIGSTETHRDDIDFYYPLAWQAFSDFTVNDSFTVVPGIVVIESRW